MLRRHFLGGAVALALKRDRLDAAVAIIEKATAAGYFSAAALHVKQGSFELSRAFGKVFGPDTPFLLASITKPMTATAVMILSDRKALALIDPVRKFIPEFTGGDRDSITIKTGDHIKGWSAGLVWVFFQSFILMAGGFIAPYIRKITPRAALLGTLAGVSVTFISMRPALEMYMTPQIGLVCFAIILVSWFGGVKYWKGMPAGLVAIAVGMIIAWGSNLFGLGLGGLSLKGLGDAFANFGFSVPLPAVGHVFSGFEFLGIILVTAIPFGIYDLVEAMDNVESAEAAGD